MSNRSFVTIIIIFLNAAEFLREAIESVLAQTYEHWELLLVDDGSSDGSSEIARGFASQDPLRIRYLEHDGHQNLGMSATRNLGIRKAKGEYIAFLDSDDYWLPNRLETHVGVLDAFPQVGMLYGTTKYWYSWTNRAEDCERDFVPELRVRKNSLFYPPELFLLLLDGKAEVPCTCSILVRREIIQKVGGFEESFRGMYEDQAFYAKMCLYAPVLATDDCLAWYRQHPDSSTGVVHRSRQILKTRERYLNWLEGYLTEANCLDQTLWQSLRRELWLLKTPVWLSQAPQLLSFLRWAKKWLLRTSLMRFR
jgi:glycosyltransferase involved in cell wall biosynthesis